MIDKKYDPEIIRKNFEAIEAELIEETPGRINALLSPQVAGFDADEMTARIRFEKKEWEKNQRDELHGGAISSMFDVSMGMSLCAFENADTTTADLSVSFIRPFMGEAFIIEVEITHPGRNLVRIRSKAFDEESGKLLATATGNFVKLK